MAYALRVMKDHYRTGFRGDLLPTITIQHEFLRKFLNNEGVEFEPQRLIDELPLIGTDVDKCDENELVVEIFPDRPDLLSGETLATAIAQFLYHKDSNPSIDVQPPSISMTVDKSLTEVRPVVFGAVVRGVKVEDGEVDEFIKMLMEHQEKLHFALGRGRGRASIGVHDLDTLAPPFTVTTVDRSFAFPPLGEEEPMSIQDILERHPKGIDYAHLLDGFEKVPIILDAQQKVLSFPPIINGNHTTVTNKTRNFFIDVTGLDQKACECCLLLVALQLQQWGGTVEAIELTDVHGTTTSFPNGEPELHVIPETLVEAFLGRTFSDEQLRSSMNRMGGQFVERRSDGTIAFNMARWRYDLLHPVDVVEDIAIGHGYEDLGEAQPQFAMAGVPRADAHIRRRIRESMQGIGFMQVQSLTLSNPTDQFEKMRWQQLHEVTEIANPITHEHTMMRQYILPSLLKLLSSNKHHELPQLFYELGTVVRHHKNETRLAFVCAEKSGGFATLRGRIQAFCLDLGITNWRLEPIEDGDGPWLNGRGAKFFIGDDWVGCIGEIDPNVSITFDLRVPLSGGDFDIGLMTSILEDPVG